jgi:hypothetical protein
VTSTIAIQCWLQRSGLWNGVYMTSVCGDWAPFVRVTRDTAPPNYINGQGGVPKSRGPTEACKEGPEWSCKTASVDCNLNTPRLPLAKLKIGGTPSASG